MWGVTIALSMALAVGLFFVIPVGATSLIKDWLGSALLFWLVEGVLRTLIFIGYIVAISRLPDLRRVFEYHGAEHKTISCFEAGRRADARRTPQRYSRLHPRCGTSFLLIVMVLAIFVFAPIGLPEWYWLLASRILGIPLIAGLSYEVIKWAGKNRNKRWVRGADVARPDAPEPDHPRARPGPARGRDPLPRGGPRQRGPREAAEEGTADRDRRLAARCRLSAEGAGSRSRVGRRGRDRRSSVPDAPSRASLTPSRRGSASPRACACASPGAGRRRRRRAWAPSCVGDAVISTA